jgi:hypothetical protein
MLKSVSKFILISSILLLNACQASNTQPIENNNSIKQHDNVKKKEVWHKVTVTYFDIEGGFYGLLSTNGEKLLPLNLSKKYQVDGTVLKVKGNIIKDMMTTQQWGVVFEIEKTEFIRHSKIINKNIL